MVYLCIRYERQNDERDTVPLISTDGSEPGLDSPEPYPGPGLDPFEYMSARL